MFKKLTSSILAAAAGLLLATSVSSAAVFDFVAIADSGAAPLYGEKGGNPLSFLSGTMTLDATGTKGGQTAYAYLDKSSDPTTSTGPAGLGVCGAINGPLQCVPGSDDNVTTAEILTLTFGEKTTLVDWGFNGKTHGADFDPGNTLDLRVDGGAWVSMALDIAGFTNFNDISGTVFDLRWADTDFYLANVSAVPLPPAVLLFGASLLGLGWLGRRRKSA